MAVKPHTSPLSHAFCRKEEQKARLRYSAARPEALPPPCLKHCRRPPPSSCSSEAGCGQRPRRLRSTLQATAWRCPPQGKPAAQQRREYTPLLRLIANRSCPAAHAASACLPALCQRGSTSAPALWSPPPARSTAPAAALWRQAASRSSARTGARCFCLACPPGFCAAAGHAPARGGAGRVQPMPKGVRTP